jgi:hypothetical protein
MCCKIMKRLIVILPGEYPNKSRLNPELNNYLLSRKRNTRQYYVSSEMFPRTLGVTQVITSEASLELHFHTTKTTVLLLNFCKIIQANPTFCQFLKQTVACIFCTLCLTSLMSLKFVYILRFYLLWMSVVHLEGALKFLSIFVIQINTLFSIFVAKCVFIYLSTYYLVLNI